VGAQRRVFLFLSAGHIYTSMPAKQAPAKADTKKDNSAKKEAAPKKEAVPKKEAAPKKEAVPKAEGAAKPAAPKAEGAAKPAAPKPAAAKKDGAPKAGSSKAAAKTAAPQKGVQKGVTTAGAKKSAKKVVKKAVAVPVQRGFKKIRLNKYTIDLGAPVADGILDAASFEKFFHDKFKVGTGPTHKAGVLENKVVITRDKAKITVTLNNLIIHKRYVKYLTKKYLKKQQVGDWLRVVAIGQSGFELRYYNIQENEAEGEESEDES